jgi:hypothetical protein
VVEFPGHSTDPDPFDSTTTGSATYTWQSKVPGTCASGRLISKPEGGMATKLDKTIKRELDLQGKLYTVAISPEGIKVTPKGARKGHEVSWSTLVGGDAEQPRETGMSSEAF